MACWATRWPPVGTNEAQNHARTEMQDQEHKLITAIHQIADSRGAKCLIPVYQDHVDVLIAKGFIPRARST